LTYIISLFILILIGIPIANALGFSSILYFIQQKGMLLIFPSRFYAGINKFVLLSIPFFLLAAEFMNSSGITKDLVNFVNIFIGRFRGGLAQVNIYTSIIFAGITGAAVADVSTLGAIFIPSMVKQGYTRKYSAAITAASSIVGPIIPPSINIIVYCAVTGLSVGAFFLAAFIPGLLLGIAMSIYTIFQAKIKNFPKVEVKIQKNERFKKIKSGLVALVMPIIILGGILGGIFTPTEAAAVASFYALVIGIFTRKLNKENIFLCMRKAVYTSSNVLFVIGFCSAFGWVSAKAGVTELVSNYFLNSINSPTNFLLLIMVLLFFVGTWLDTGAAIVLLAPILLPVAKEFGINPLHFATVMLVTIEIGLITPPVGICLFAVSSVGKIKIEEILPEIFPLIIIDFLVVIILIYFPQICLFLPRIFGFLS